MKPEILKQACNCDNCCIDSICRATKKSQCGKHLGNFCIVDECHFFGRCLYAYDNKSCANSARVDEEIAV